MELSKPFNEKVEPHPQVDKWEVSGMGPDVATVLQSKPLNHSLIQLTIFLIEEGGGST